MFVKILLTIAPLTLSALTLEEKVGQLFVIPICPAHGEQHVEKVHKLLKEKHIGGIIFMEGTSEEQMEIIQGFDTQPLTFQDAEWGVGMRLKDVYSNKLKNWEFDKEVPPIFQIRRASVFIDTERGIDEKAGEKPMRSKTNSSICLSITPMPKNLTLGAIQDLELLRAFGRELARQCRSVGIFGNFAPVVDINTNPKNPVIGNRSFGDDPQEVTRRALAVMEGMQEGGIWTCAKHFPGHGDTAVDSHLGLPKIDKSLAEMEKTELVPFHTLIQSGVDLVMVGHLYFPAISADPSSLSYEIITGLLRETLGFEGVVITDALNMRALSDRFSIEEIVTKTLLAGTDLLLTASGKPEVVDFLLEAAIPRAIDHILATIPEELIDQKYQRVQTLRKKKRPKIPPEDPEICRTLYRHAVTRIGKEISLGPSIALVQNHPDPIFAHFLKAFAEVDCFSYEEMDKSKKYSHVIVQVGPKDFPNNIPDHAILALFDTPYKLAEMTPSAAVIGYEDVFFAKEAVADVLFGKIPALGKLPIKLYTQEED